MNGHSLKGGQKNAKAVVAALAALSRSMVTRPPRPLFRVETRRAGESSPIHVAFFDDEDRANALAEKGFVRGYHTTVIDANGNIRAEFEQ